MLRPLAATAAATAAVVLLAACGGSDDKKSDAQPEDAGATAAATPSTPPVPSFDPPKAFVAASAFGIQRAGKDNQHTLKAGMVGQTSLIAGLTGITGRNIAAQGELWTVPSAAASTTETLAVTAPMSVQLDGKDVVAIAYVQNDKGNGTQKAKGQVLFQWLDATNGKKVAEVTADLTPALGPGEGGDAVVSQAYDAATGQIAVGVGAAGATAAKKGGETFTVYADPKTQKSNVIPFVTAAGVLDGMVAGAKGSNEEGATDNAIVIVDAVTGKVTKQTPISMSYVSPAGSGVKHAFFSGSKYVSDPYKTIYDSQLYSVDIANGTVISVKSQATPEEVVDFRCFSDAASAVVCSGARGAATSGLDVEILGFDDRTGKKVWGYTDKSANRIVPWVTAAFHGVIYAQTEAQPVLMNATTGEDVPTSTPTPTPSDGATPTEGATPSADPSSQGADPGSANGSDMSLYDGKLKSPTAVTQYGGTYLQSPTGGNYDLQMVLIALAPTA